MKRLILMVGVVLLMSACQSKGGAQQDNQVVAPEQVSEIVLDVEGMTCDGCEKTIEKGLMTLKGVAAVSADHETGKTIVKADTSIIGKEEMAQIIEKIGYHTK